MSNTVAPVRANGDRANHAVVTNSICLDGCHVGTDGNGPSTNGDHVPQTALQVPIAICGMSVRLPGGLHSPQELWDFLISKGDARGPVPKSRYSTAAHYSERSKPSTVNTEYGYFLDESIDLSAIDTSFFNMRKAEVERLDPQQRQILEVARECIEDAGEVHRKGRSIGCYIGTFGDDWLEMFAKENQHHGPYRATGYSDFMLPNRVTYEMDLTGPRFVR
ncbi:putative PKS/NRPS-like protein biosynthetic cluster [Aspergillus tubingensis]|nr:putative PKS/NRPS-like protein biosynthetic cluster [Aspergillus tubingensis]